LRVPYESARAGSFRAPSEKEPVRHRKEKNPQKSPPPPLMHSVSVCVALSLTAVVFAVFSDPVNEDPKNSDTKSGDYLDDEEPWDGTYRMHESGGSLQLYKLEENGRHYVMLLKAAAIETEHEDWWGTQAVGCDRIQLPVLDIPGGKTAQFDDPEFVWAYFPKHCGEDSKDATQWISRDAFPMLESAEEAAMRETREETMGVVAPQHFDKVWMVDGGRRTCDSNRTITKTLMGMTVYAGRVTRDSLHSIRSKFSLRTFEAFQRYNAWKEGHPDATEEEQWEERPEADEMYFVTCESFVAAIRASSDQLDRYEVDTSLSTAKGLVTVMEDYLGRPLFGVLRSWAVRSVRDILGEDQTVAEFCK